MCGLFGVLRLESSRTRGNMDSSYHGFFHDALLVGALRGTDGTGGFVVGVDRTHRLHKAPVPAPFFMGTRAAQELCDATKFNPLVVGHHRSATKGRLDYHTTHPFAHGEKDNYLVGVHNGHVNNAKEVEDGKRFDVDSDWAYHVLHRDGIDGYKKLRGAYTMAYYTKQDDSLILTTNGERPVYFAVVDNDEAVCFASEEGMLKWLMERNDLGIRRYVNKDGKPGTSVIHSLKKRTGIMFPLAGKNVADWKLFDLPEEEKSYWGANEHLNQGRVPKSEAQVVHFLPRPQAGKDEIKNGELHTVNGATCPLELVDQARVMNIIGKIGEFTPRGNRNTSAYGEFVFLGQIKAKVTAEINNYKGGEKRAWEAAIKRGVKLCVKVLGAFTEVVQGEHVLRLVVDKPSPYIVQPPPPIPSDDIGNRMMH